MRDFAFVAMIASVPNVLEELTALAKERPGTLNYGSVGNGSQPPNCSSR